jgi:hypothetical protein
MADHLDPLDIRAQERNKANEQAASKLAYVNEGEDFKWLMSNKRGRRVIWRWLERTGVYRSSFNHSGSITAFNEGARNIGLMLIAQVHEHCPEHYLTMLQEQRQND